MNKTKNLPGFKSVDAKQSNEDALETLIQQIDTERIGNFIRYSRFSVKVTTIEYRQDGSTIELVIGFL